MERKLKKAVRDLERDLRKTTDPKKGKQQLIDAVKWVIRSFRR